MCHIPILHVALGSDVLLPFLQGCLPVSTCTQLSTPSPMDQRAVAAPASSHCCTANCSTAVWTHCRAWPDGIYPIQFSQWGAGMAACTPGHAGAPQSVLGILVLVLGEWLWCQLQWDKGGRDLKAAFAALSMGCCLGLILRISLLFVTEPVTATCSHPVVSLPDELKPLSACQHNSYASSQMQTIFSLLCRPQICCLQQKQLPLTNLFLGLMLRN